MPPAEPPRPGGPGGGTGASGLHPCRLAIGGLLSLAVALGIGRFIYTPILPPMVETLGLGQGEAGMIASANFAGYLAGALVAAGFDARGRARTWLVLSLAASALSTGAMAWPAALAPMLLLRFAGGVASALVMVLASTLILERLARAGRSELSSLHFGGVGAGIAASAALVAILLAAGTAWQGLWLAGGALSLALLPVVMLLVPDGGGAAAPEARAGTPAAAPGGLIRLVISYGLFGVGYSITATFIVAIVRDDAAMRAIEPVVWILVGLAAVPSVWLWAQPVPRWGLLRTYAAASLAEALGVALSVLLPSILGAALAAVLLGGTFVAITALGLLAARAMAPANPQRALALMTASFGFGQIAGPAAAGWVHDLVGSFTLVSLIAAAGLVLGVALTWRLGRPPRLTS